MSWRSARRDPYAPLQACPVRGQLRSPESDTGTGCVIRCPHLMAGDETMDYEHILVDVEDGVATLTLNRPAQLNAMNRKLGRELHDAVKQAEADDAIGCIVITGAGDRAFSAGGDIKEQLSNDAQYSDTELD